MRCQHNRHRLKALALGAPLAVGLIAGISDGLLASTAAQAATSQTATIALAEPTCSIAPSGFQGGDTTASVGIGEELTQPLPNGTVKPWLARSYRRTGSTTWQIKLRPNAHFQNGQSVTASAVAAVLHKETSSGYAQDSLTGSRVTASGRWTVDIKTVKPSATVPYDLGDIYTYPIYDLAAATKAGSSQQALIKAGIWTGPYKPVSVTPQKIVTERFSGWWGGRAAMAGLTLLCVSDPQARVLAVESGQADIALAPPSSAQLALKGNSRATYVPPAGVYTDTLLEPNVKQAPFNNANVRRAFALAINYQSLVSSVPNKPFQAADGIFPSQLPYAIATQTTDRAKAAKLLTQAGYKKGSSGIYAKDGKPLKVVLLYSPSADPDHQALAVALASQLQPFGIQVVPQEVESAYDDQGWPSGWSAMLNLVNLQGISNDPAQSIGSYIGGHGGQNFGGVNDPVLNGLLTKISGSLGTAKGVSLLKSAQRRIAAEGDGIVLGRSSVAAVVSPAFRNFRPNPQYLYIGGSLKPEA